MAFYVKIEIIQILLLDLLRLIPLKNKISTPLGQTFSKSKRPRTDFFFRYYICDSKIVEKIYRSNSASLYLKRYLMSKLTFRSKMAHCKKYVFKSKII